MDVTNIFVGNLSFDATESDIRTAFERYGKVSSVQVVSDRGTGRSRGFAFVTMPHFEDADEAVLRMNGSSLCGRALRVNVAEGRRDRPQVPREPSRLHLI
jgi:RNA recognition motif-containing protein